MLSPEIFEESSENPLDSRTECPSEMCLSEELTMVSEGEMSIKPPLVLQNRPAESAVAMSLVQSGRVSAMAFAASMTRSGGISLV